MQVGQGQITVMCRLKYLAVLAAVVGCLCAGCHTYQPGHGNLLDEGPEPVQQLVEERLAEQRSDRTGDERWEQFRQSRYQSVLDIEMDRRQIDLDRRRQERAAGMMAAGPVRLMDCLVFGLEFNDVIQARRAQIEAVGGDELIVRSRFLPHLSFGLEKENIESKAGVDGIDRTDSFFRLSHTLLEFGKDNESDVVLRQEQRDALFEYEDAVSGVLSEIRLRFFTILLRQEQLAERVVLLGEFREQYERVNSRYEKKQVVEVDVLTARLNMLNEEARINSLKKEVLRQQIDLLGLLGFPVGLTGFEVSGALELFELDPDSTVDISLSRSTSIAEARAWVAEQVRRVRQVLWEYGPDVDVQTGWKDGKNVVGIELAGDDGAYGLSPFAESHIEDTTEGFVADNDVLDQAESGWFLGLTLELPIFQGLERKGRLARETALLKEARHELRGTIDSVEQEVRKDYQTMLEQRQQLEILAETVAISKKRLKAKERLKELDRISDDELETFRERFFNDQDAYFAQQIEHVAAQEGLRAGMRYFETLPARWTGDGVSDK